MKNPRVPSIFVGGVATLPDLVLHLARTKGLNRDQAQRIVGLLPEKLGAAPCFLDKMTNLRRYDFGVPIADLPDDPNGMIAWGTHMFVRVDHLFLVLCCALQRLPDETLTNYLLRLDDPGKHLDHLVEFQPIVRLEASTLAEYEMPGGGRGTVDWRVVSSSGIPVLLDVKNRWRDLIEGLAQMASARRNADGVAPEPVHDAASLFLSLESKFAAQKPDDCLQGAWITTQIRQEETELRDAFAQLDSSRIHFAILGDWEEDVYVLAPNEVVRRAVKERFHLTESERFIFHRGVLPTA